jgi:hypothetical protein
MIIGVCGLIGSGKNTVADYLVKEHDFVPVSFAAVLKDACASLFGWDRDMLEGKSEESRIQREQVDKFWAERLEIPCFTPRYALQYIGTDVMRNHFHSDIWVIAAEKRMWKYDNVVISDVRFPNEMAMIRRNGGQIWCVERTRPLWYNTALYETENMANDYPEVHPSEFVWVGEKFDKIILNRSTLDQLYINVEGVLGNEYLCA